MHIVNTVLKQNIMQQCSIISFVFNVIMVTGLDFFKKIIMRLKTFILYDTCKDI